MKKHLKRLPLYIPLAIVLVFLVFWGVSLLKCETLTNEYSEELKYAHTENTMLGKIESCKVLACDGVTARVYYVCDYNTSGHILEFEKQNDEWKETNWETVWSKQGSADKMLWPYWWHTYSINSKSDVYESKLDAVLNNRLCFLNESGEAVYLKNFSYDAKDEYRAKPTRYTYVYLDSENGNELVVDIANGNAYLVLYDNGKSVYGYLLSAKELQNIKQDGTFMQSAGAKNIYYCNLSFNENNYKVNCLAAADGGNYKINGEHSWAWEFEDYREKQNNKKEVDWISIEN